MKSRTLFTSALALLALALLPATAAAAGTVTGGPAKVKGYTVFLHATDAKKDSFTISIEKGNEASGIAEVLTFSSGVKVVVAGSRASIRGGLGSRGAVNLKLVNARVASKRKESKRCTGKPGVLRTGRLVGKLRLRLPNGKFTVIRALPASSYIGGNITCEDGSDNGRGDGGGDVERDDEARLMLTMDWHGATTSFFATKNLLLLSRFSQPRKERGVTVAVQQLARASGSNLLAVQGGGATATVKAAGPFTGSGLFSAGTNFGSMATGPLSGNLTVKLDGVPAVAIAGENAILFNGTAAQ